MTIQKKTQAGTIIYTSIDDNINLIDYLETDIFQTCNHLGWSFNRTRQGDNFSKWEVWLPDSVVPEFFIISSVDVFIDTNNPKERWKIVLRPQSGSRTTVVEKSEAEYLIKDLESRFNQTLLNWNEKHTKEKPLLIPTPPPVTNATPSSRNNANTSVEPKKPNNQFIERALIWRDIRAWVKMGSVAPTPKDCLAQLNKKPAYRNKMISYKRMTRIIKEGFGGTYDDFLKTSKNF